MRAKHMAVLMTVMLGAYLLFVVARGIDFIGAGGVAPTLLGVAVLVMPVLGMWVLAAEWRFGRATQRLAGELDARGAMPVDDLPRRPSGRPVREAADARFAEVRRRVEADPGAWPRWFELATAYDACGDRRRARAAMRRAIDLHAAGSAPR